MGEFTVTIGRPVTPVEVRFWAKVRRTRKCWEWQGSKTDKGYGQIRLGPPNYDMVYAHRLSYVLHVSELSVDELVLHECDNPGCVNPRHRYAGTHQNNSDDKFNRGRQRYLYGDDNPMSAKRRAERQRHDAS